MSKFIDLTGQRFGRLVVLKLDTERSNIKIKYWICQCDCGKIISVCTNNLKRGNTKSCGCLIRDLTIQRNSKSNHIEFDSNYGCLRVYFNNCNEYFLCDIEDRDIVEKYTWFFCNGYAVCTVKDYNNIRHTVKFHRLVMEKYNGDISNFQVDHQNHNTIDNRKFNLRLCTNGENGKNRRAMSNSGEKYIYYISDREKYHVYMDNKYIGYSKDLNEAVEIRDNYIKEHPDKFRYDNNEDYKNKNNPNVIYPFTFINPDNIIQPFKNFDK